MKYSSYEAPIEELIKVKLQEIEQKENVKVFHAVESGSRAWGFASPDSDYDVRFIYARPMEYYLGLDTKKDFIDWELNETLDINGWDLSKALQHFHKSNATMFEWSNSPIIYTTTPEWEEVKKVSESYFSCKSAMYHYYGTANKNYLAYLTEDYVKYKKYFYVLRPILACKWIETKKCPPPVLFQTLTEEVLEDEMKPVIEKLVSRKVQMSEADKDKKIEPVNKYIEANLAYYREMLQNMEDDRTKEWETINRLFIQMIRSGNRIA